MNHLRILKSAQLYTGKEDTTLLLPNYIVNLLSCPPANACSKKMFSMAGSIMRPETQIATINAQPLSVLTAVLPRFSSCWRHCLTWSQIRYERGWLHFPSGKLFMPAFAQVVSNLALHPDRTFGGSNSSNSLPPRPYTRLYQNLSQRTVTLFD